MNSSMIIARGYAARGWRVIPIPRGKKCPRFKGWTELRIRDEEVDQYFGDEEANVGVLLGDASRRLVDVDLDCEEACAIAGAFLPATNSVFGRASKPASHYLYYATLESERLIDPTDKSTLVEIRSSGCQTVFPGSLHPSGEIVVWYEDGAVAELQPQALLSAVRRLGAASLLARHWPAEGGRHDAQLTLSALLVRSGWPVEETARFVAAVSSAAGGDPELQKRRAAAQDAAERLTAGRLLRGLPALRELMGEAVAARVAEWLCLSPDAAIQPAAPNDGSLKPAPLIIGSDVEIAQRISTQLREQHGEVVFCEGKLWHYRGTHWQAFCANELRRNVHAFDGAPINDNRPRPGRVRLGKSRIDSISNELNAICMQDCFFSLPARGINCTSGFIEFSGSGDPQLVPHDPAHRVRYVINGTWTVAIDENNVKTSLLCRLLEGVFLGDPDAQAKVDLVAEIGAAAALGLATDLSEPKAIVLYGATAGNGKSQILDLLRGIIPREVVAVVPAQKLHDEKYLVQLAGRLLNACDELSTATAIGSDIFKQVVTGEPVSARDLYRSPIEFRCRAQHVFATNSLPTFKGGMDRGVRRRILVVDFNRTIPHEERIPGIGRRVCAEEPDLLLDWIVQGASRLIRQAAFTCPPSSGAAGREWFLGSDPVLAWAEEAIALDPAAPRIKTAVVYRHFKSWAIYEGFEETRLPAVHAFTQRLIGAVPGVERARSSKQRSLMGLRLLGVLPETEVAGAERPAEQKWGRK